MTEEKSAVAVAEERAHHDYSPSSLQNLEACPCFLNRKSVNNAAIAGTRQHAVTETREDDQRLDDDEALAAAECLDFYERQKLLYVEDRNRAFEAAGKPDIFPDIVELTESYLPVDDLKFEDLTETPGVLRKVSSTTAGYVDRALISWDRTHGALLDWKFGAWAVEKASDNLQGIAYTLGLFKKYPTLEKITFFFKQPKLNLLTEATFTRSQIPELYLRVQTTVARARLARARMITSEDFGMAEPKVPACNFCANIGRCPKVAEFACKVGAKFYPLAIPSDITPTGLKSAEDTTLGLRLAQVMGVWAQAFRAQVTDRTIRMAAPVPPGYKIQTRADREIADPVKFKDVTLRYVTESELASVASYTFGAVEAIIKTNAPRGSKQSTLEAYQQALIDENAVKKGDPYSFLRADSGAKDS